MTNYTTTPSIDHIELLRKLGRAAGSDELDNWEILDEDDEENENNYEEEEDVILWIEINFHLLYEYDYIVRRFLLQ